MKMNRRIAGLAVGATVAAALVIAALGYGWRWYSGTSESSTDAVSAAPQESEFADRAIVLEGERLAAAGLRVGKVERRELRSTRVVPGRVRYDATHQADVLAATDGILVGIFVKPGEMVSQGQVLATLSSPEIGRARAALLKDLAELKLVNERHRWNREVHATVDRLAETIRENVPMDRLHTDYGQTRLGKYRDLMLSAYSRYLLARELAKGTTSAAASGAISPKTVRERASELESAEAALNAVLEQSEFDIHQEELRTQVEQDAAERQVDLTRQTLHALLGYVEDQETLEGIARDPAKLPQVEIRAPFAATVERNHVSVATRVHQGDPLLTLANTRQLWIAADLREQDWQALELREGDEVVVTSPALPNREMSARVVFVGREVAPETNSVPLIAAIDNADGKLRPGLFVRVRLPIGESRQTLMVPESAICVHEGRRFVFVAEPPHAFRPRTVDTGTTEGDWIEVLSGVVEQQEVAVAGAFVLKSELILEREE